MTSAFELTGCLLIPLALYFLYYIVERMRRHEPLLADQDYRREADGSMIAPNARFDAQGRVLELPHQKIEFSRIKGVYVRGISSRRLAIGVILNDDNWVQVSYVSNNEMNRAAYNAELVAEVVAHDSLGFKNASHEFKWQPVLMGQPFVYEFRRAVR